LFKKDPTEIILYLVNFAELMNLFNKLFTAAALSAANIRCEFLSCIHGASQRKNALISWLLEVLQSENEILKKMMIFYVVVKLLIESSY
jgi:hypothetical protein